MKRIYLITILLSIAYFVNGQVQINYQPTTDLLVKINKVNMATQSPDCLAATISSMFIRTERRNHKYTRSSSAINPRRARTTPWFLKKKACASAQFPILNKKDLSYVHNSLFLPEKAYCAWIIRYPRQKKPIVQTHKSISMKNNKLCMHDKTFKRFLSCGLENKRFFTPAQLVVQTINNI